MGDKWGVTHCPACEMPFPTEAERAEYNVRYKRYGEKNAEAWSRAYCWVPCDDICISESRTGNTCDLLVYLRERIDELEATLANQWHWERGTPVTFLSCKG